MAISGDNQGRIDALAARAGYSVNEKLVDRAIRHAHWIEAYKGGEAREVLGFIDTAILPDLNRGVLDRLARIERYGFDTGPATTRRLVDMRSWYSGYLDEGFRKLNAQQEGRFVELAKAEGRMEFEGIKRLIPPELSVEISVVAPTGSSLSSIVRTQPIQGAVLGEWYGSLSASTAETISRQLRIGVLSGETAEQMTTRIFGRAAEAFGAPGTPVAIMRRNAMTVTRTAVTGITARAREETYRENADVVGQVMIVATLDARTTDICMSLDGKVFGVDEGPRPEFHHQCRTTTVPVLRSLKEMGITTKDIDLTPSTRASMNGQVAAAQNYGTWLKGQSVEVQNAALGRGRADLFRRGVVPVERFVDRKLRPLNLGELVKLEKKIEEGVVSRFPRPLPGEVRSKSRLSS